MPIADLLKEGLYLMLLGMGTVFTFLTMLVGAMKLMSLAAKQLAGNQFVEMPVPTQSPPQTDQGKELVAVIAAAVHCYRKGRR